MYKLSKRLNRITGLQVTSPLVEKVERQLPSSFNEHLPFVESEALQVGIIMIQNLAQPMIRIIPYTSFSNFQFINHIIKDSSIQGKLIV